MKVTAGAHQVPNPSYVTQRDDGGTGSITTSETVLSTAPSIKGGDAPKKIDFSCNINPDGAGQVLTFRLYRNGTQISSASDTFRKGLPATTDIDPITLHWVDESPGKATPVYEVRATSTVDGTVNASSRRLTIHNI